jgi:Ca2+-binding RTX toxin-like protein
MKKILRNKILKISIILLLLITTYNFAAPNFLDSTTAYAVGDLNIDWGVPSGDPIFVVENMLPGDMESREVEVTNNASTSRPIGIRSIKTLETKAFSTVLDFVILDGATPIYGTGSPTGPKTLDEFFAESSAIDGISLTTLSSSASKTFTFKVTFEESANNDFQKAQVIFDLIIGIGFDVPQECLDINFFGSPIFGTEGDDKIKGTNKNDLIIAFEGNDKVKASNGDDCIIGGPGDDKLDGSNGKDVIFGNEGDDVLDGSNGGDILIGGEGNDKLKGTNGKDYLDGGPGNDKVDASNGDDEIFGGEGDDEIKASNGDDFIIAGPGNDKVDAGNGNDYVEGNEGDDELRGRNGNDTLLGGADNDIARGDSGTDTCDAEVIFSCEL